MRVINREQRFQEAISEYGALINKICYFYSLDGEEFQDLRQDTFLNIWRGLDKFEEKSKLSTWIYRVCFNTCISYRRKERHKQNSVSLNEIIEMPAEDTDFDLESYNRMHSLISKLNYQDRAIILMWLDEKTYEEIAELMGMSRNNVAVRISRIKEKLAKMSR